MVSPQIIAALATVVGSISGVNAADCKVATVASGDTCDGIRIAAGITLAQLMTFNPGLDCSLLQPGQKLCVSTGTIPGQPQQNPDGSCAAYTVVANDTCSSLASKFSITTANIESWNTNTWKWKGCAGLQIGENICVSTGTPPPIPYAEVFLRL
ncbi:hypothetical protein FB451DRAFT_253362 [Mycena latifolia]|nr:hypothetical protein FB451DRAFT_253362 [Mycena latifolia]